MSTPKIERPKSNALNIAAPTVEKTTPKGGLLFTKKDGGSLNITPTAAPAKPAGPVIEKPHKAPTVTAATPKYTIQKPTKGDKLLFEKNTIEKAREWLKAFLEMKIEITQTPLFEHVVKMNDQLLRYRFKRQDNKSGKTAPIKRDEIKLLVNKLTMENYYSQINKVIVPENLSNVNYITNLVDTVHEAAINGYPLTNLFSLFIGTVYSTLDEENTKNERDALTTELIKLIHEEFNKEIDDNNAVQFDKYVNNAIFFGCLVMREIFSIEELYKIALDRLKRRQPYDISALIKLLLPVAGRLEQQIPDATKTIYSELEKIKTDKKYHSRIRFIIMDLLDIRNAKWEGVEKQFPQINAIQKQLKRQEKKKEIAHKAEASHKIEAGVNKFAGLASDDDDEEVLPEFNPDEMIGEYCTDEVIVNNWEYTTDTEPLIEAIVELNKQRALKFIEIFSDLHSDERFSPEIAADACKSIFDKRDDYSDLQTAMNILGHIFARVAVLQDGLIDEFDKYFNSYNFEVIYGFFEEMARMKKTDQLTESPYWSDLKWRPRTVSQNVITEALMQNDKLLEAFPLYDYLFRVHDILIAPEDMEEDDNFDVLGAIDELLEELPSDIATSFEFILGVMEIAFDAQSSNEQQAQESIAKLIPKKDSPDFQVIKEEGVQLLEAFEKISFEASKPVDDIVQWLKKLGELGFPITEFAQKALDEKVANSQFGNYHKRITAGL